MSIDQSGMIENGVVGKVEETKPAADSAFDADTRGIDHRCPECAEPNVLHLNVYEAHYHCPECDAEICYEDLEERIEELEQLLELMRMLPRITK